MVTSMKIMHKLTLSVVGIALMVPVVGALSIHAARKAIERSAGEAAVALTSRMLSQVDHELQEEVSWFQELTGVPIVQEIVGESNRRFSAMEDPTAFLAEQDAKWTSAQRDEISPFMQDIIGNPISERLRRKMEFSQSEHGCRMYGEIFITNKYGANVAQTCRTSDYDQSDEEWWQLARRDGLYVSDVEYDDSSGIYAMHICVRIDDPDHGFAGVMKAVMNIEGIIKTVKNADTATGSDSSLELLDRHDMVLYPRDYAAGDSNMPGCRPTGDTADGCAWNICYAVQPGEEPGKCDKLVAHAHSPKSAEFAGMGWTLVLKRDMDAVLAPMASLRKHVLTVSFAVMIAAIAMGTRIAGRITRQLSTLAQAASQIGIGRFDTKIEKYSDDEIGNLTESLSKMAANLESTTTTIGALNLEIAERQRAEEELARTNKRMLEAARDAGKAEVASAVLHNVGNAVNSINVIAATIKSRLSRLKLGNLAKAAAMLEQHRDNLGEFLTNDERGSKLPPYLISLSAELDQEQKYMLEKMAALNGQIHHTAGIINIQQSHSRVKVLVESAPVADMIEDAVRINAATLEQHSIEIVRKYADLPSIEVDRSMVIQILVNLIGNAIYAVLATDNHRKVITLSARKMTEEFVQIEVADNGIGISRENAEHLFEYGFTTKKKGHGFGLHGGSVAAKEMGGKLIAYSRGAGKGATFILELPVKCQRQVEAQV